LKALADEGKAAGNGEVENRYATAAACESGEGIESTPKRAAKKPAGKKP
jgi:hypothetical protein